MLSKEPLQSVLVCQTEHTESIQLPEIGTNGAKSNPNARKGGEESDHELPSRSEQNALLQQSLSAELEAGQARFLLPAAWLKAWNAYILDPSSTHPAIINTANLLEDGELKADLKLGHDIEAIPSEGWKLLSSWYGINGPEIKRYVIADSGLKLELYPSSIQLIKILADPPETDLPQYEIPLSVSMKVYEFRGLVQEKLGLHFNSELRFYRVPDKAEGATSGGWIRQDALSPGDRINTEIFSAELAKIGVSAQMHVIAVDVKDTAQPGGWLVQPDDPQTKNVSWGYTNQSRQPQVSFQYSQTMDKRVQPRSKLRDEEQGYGRRVDSAVHIGRGGGQFASGMLPPHSPTRRNQFPGVTGLQNLGNTCFMNSALQCLSAVRDLSLYFLLDKHIAEINEVNPLGMKGEVATEYGKLVDRLWRGLSSVVAPREFKGTIGQYAPAFSGYSQHDAQEFLAFLLDGLHEDLNRIIKKPYIEIPDSDGRDDEIVAKELWQIHLQRNNSIIVDLFQGLYRSRLECPVCQTISVKFDPFMYLTLPVPFEKMVKIKITFVPLDTSLLHKEVHIKISSKCKIKDIKSMVAQIVGLGNDKLDNLLVVEIFNHSIAHLYSDDEGVPLSYETVYMYELPFSYPPPEGYTFIVSLNAIKTSDENDEDTNDYGYSRMRYHPELKKFGVPVITCLNSEQAKDYQSIYEEAVKSVQRYTTIDLFQAMQSSSFETAYTDVSMASDSVSNGSAEAEISDPISMDSDSVNDVPEAKKQKIETETEAIEGRAFPDLFTIKKCKKKQSITNSSQRLFRADFTDLEGDQDISVTTGEIVLLHWPQRVHDICFPPRDNWKGAGFSRMFNSYDDVESEGDSIDLRQQNKYTPGSTRDYNMGVSLFGLHTVVPVPDYEQSEDRKLDLSKCLDEFTREEKLGESETWYCPKCKEHQQATKNMSLWKIPKVLVVHLKRFGNRREKLDCMVEFPLKSLDLSNWMPNILTDSKSEYDLFGVVNHFGSLYFGHYTAYAKNFANNRWYDFDDSHVREIDEDAVQSKAAYLLFYKQKSGDSDSPITEVPESTLFDTAVSGTMNSILHTLMPSSFYNGSESGDGDTQTPPTMGTGATTPEYTTFDNKDGGWEEEAANTEGIFQVSEDDEPQEYLSGKIRRTARKDIELSSLKQNSIYESDDELA